MSRYDPESLRDAIAMATALVSGDESTFARLVDECAQHRAETTIAVLAFVVSRMTYNAARLARTDLTPGEQAAMTWDDLRESALEVLTMYGTSFAQQLEDEREPPPDQ